MKHKKPDLCVTEFYKAYPQNGHDQHTNELYVINFMDQNLCVIKLLIYFMYIHIFIVYNSNKCQCIIAAIVFAFFLACTLPYLAKSIYPVGY